MFEILVYMLYMIGIAIAGGILLVILGFAALVVKACVDVYREKKHGKEK